MKQIISVEKEPYKAAPEMSAKVCFPCLVSNIIGSKYTLRLSKGKSVQLDKFQLGRLSCFLESPPGTKMEIIPLKKLKDFNRQERSVLTLRASKGLLGDATFHFHLHNGSNVLKHGAVHFLKEGVENLLLDISYLIK